MVRAVKRKIFHRNKSGNLFSRFQALASLSRSARKILSSLGLSKRRHPLAIPITRYHGRLGCLTRIFIDTSKFFRLTGLGFNSVLPFEFPLNFSSKNFDEKQAAIYCGPA